MQFVLSVASSFTKIISGLGGNFSRPAFFSLKASPLSPLLRRAALALLVFAFLAAAPSGAQSWRRLGPTGGNVISLAAATDGTVYLGTPDGHIFVSSDRGTHWQIAGRVDARLDGVVQRLIADPKTPGRILAAVWFQDSTHGGGVFESLDRAQHWKPAGLGGEAVRALELSPSNPKIWVAGTRSGVFRSSDDAGSWERITRADDGELQNVDSLAIDPANSEIIYVGTYHLPWKTIDGGNNWTSIATGMIDDSDIMSLRIDAGNPQRIFSSACSGIYRSEDAGASWTKLQGIPYSSRRTQQIAQDPKNPSTLFAATTEGLWQTSDYGESWTRITPRETVANTVLILSPGSADNQTRILAGMEAQGILRNGASAVSFEPSNEGFSHRIISTIASDSRDPSHLLARADGFGNSLLETRDAGLTWSEFSASHPPKTIAEIFSSSNGWWVFFLEGGAARFDPEKGNWRQVAFRATPSDISATPRATPGKSRQKPRMVSPRVFSIIERDAETIVATGDGLWKKKSSDWEFHRVSGAVLPSPVTFLTAYSREGLLAIAGNLIWSYDGVSAWLPIAAPAQAGRLLWVRIGPVADSSKILLGTERGVFARASDSVWRLISSGLPSIGSESPAISGSTLLIAMNSGGIYESSDSGSSWHRVDSSAEESSVTAVLVKDAHSFFVASRSEGLLSVSLRKRLDTSAAETFPPISVPKIDRNQRFTQFFALSTEHLPPAPRFAIW